MPRCEFCEHWKPEWAPYIKKQVMACELSTRNPSCKGDFKEKEYGSTIKSRNKNSK